MTEEAKEFSQDPAFARHWVLGFCLEHVFLERSFLMKQFHQKKCDVKNGKYRPRSSSDKLWYDKVIFQGKRGFTDLDAFPCQFRGTLDTLEHHECRELPPGKLSYYNRSDVQLTNREELELSDKETLTEGDQEILRAFTRRTLLVMNELIDIATARLNDKKATAEMRKEMTRLTKVTLPFLSK